MRFRLILKKSRRSQIGKRSSAAPRKGLLDEKLCERLPVSSYPLFVLGNRE